MSAQRNSSSDDRPTPTEPPPMNPRWRSMHPGWRCVAACRYQSVGTTIDRWLFRASLVDICLSIGVCGWVPRDVVQLSPAVFINTSFPPTWIVVCYRASPPGECCLLIYGAELLVRRISARRWAEGTRLVMMARASQVGSPSGVPRVAQVACAIVDRARADRCRSCRWGCRRSCGIPLLPMSLKFRPT